MTGASTKRHLQEAVVERLQSPFLPSQDGEEAKPNPIVERGVPVLSRLIKDIDSEIDDSLTNIGINVFVHPAKGKGAKHYGDCTVFNNATFDVTVMEEPTTNETGLDAWEVCDLVNQLLSLWTPPLEKAQMISLDEDPESDDSKGNLRIFSEKFNLMFIV